MTDGRQLVAGMNRASGGPFAALNDIAELQIVPTYLDGNPTTWRPQIYRVVPREPTRPPTLTVTTARVSAWSVGPPLLP
jgi:hypothetical protein